MGSTKRDGWGPAASQSWDFEADRVLVSRQHRAAPTGEGSERGVDAGERSPASLPAIAALLQYLVGSPGAASQQPH